MRLFKLVWFASYASGVFIAPTVNDQVSPFEAAILDPTPFADHAVSPANSDIGHNSPHNEMAAFNSDTSTLHGSPFGFVETDQDDLLNDFFGDRPLVSSLLSFLFDDGLFSWHFDGQFGDVVTSPSSLASTPDSDAANTQADSANADAVAPDHPWPMPTLLPIVPSNPLDEGADVSARTGLNLIIPMVSDTPVITVTSTDFIPFDTSSNVCDISDPARQSDLTIVNYEPIQELSLTDTALLFQVWVDDYLVLQVPSRFQAEQIAQRLRDWVQRPDFDATDLQPGWLNNNPVGLIGDRPLFTVDEAVVNALHRNSDLLAIEWVNNIRMAMGAESLTLTDAQSMMHDLVATGDRVDGIASWYGPYFDGRLTAAGEQFDQEELTAAHPTLPFGTYLKVTNLKNGNSVIVRINDRGPYVGSRSLDLSRQAAECLGSEDLGVVPYEAEVLESVKPTGNDSLAMDLDRPSSADSDSLAFEFQSVLKARQTLRLLHPIS
jgi:rare lipoprotein A (peptidoglycan hydrolase)